LAERSHIISHLCAAAGLLKVMINGSSWFSFFPECFGEKNLLDNSIFEKTKGCSFLPHSKSQNCSTDKRMGD